MFYSTDDEYRRLAQQCDISNWLDALAHVSFRSVCVPLSPEAIGAIIQGHHSVQAGECVDDAISLPALNHLGLLIERAMVELGCRECFVRLDTRSMKDVPILESELFRECVERCEAEMTHPVDAGSKPNRINLRMRG